MKNTEVNAVVAPTVSKEFKASVQQLVLADNALDKAIDKVETQGRNLVSVLIDEVIKLSKQITVSNSTKKTPKVFRQDTAFKILKDYETAPRYQKCLSIARGMITNGYDAGNYRDATISEMKQLIELKPPKNEVKKDLKGALKQAKQDKEATKSDKALSKLNADTQLKDMISGLTSEQLITLKGYLNTLKAK